MDLSEESDATGLPHGTLCQSLIVLARLLIAVTDMGLQSVFLKGFRTQPSCIAGHFVRTPGNVGAEIWCIDVI